MLLRDLFLLKLNISFFQYHRFSLIFSYAIFFKNNAPELMQRDVHPRIKDDQETVPGGQIARANWLNYAISLPHSLSRYTERRQRSKLVSYGGPLNTGWRVKSVIKIINGSSARAFPYRRSTTRPRIASVKGDNTQRSLLHLPHSPLSFSSPFCRACGAFCGAFSIFFLLLSCFAAAREWNLSIRKDINADIR